MNKLTVWSKDSYINENFDYTFNSKITEYDIKEAGYNLTIYFDLLPKKKIDYLHSLGKEERHIQIGLYMRSDRDYNTNLTESFGKMRKKFMEDNNLVDNDILSIKKDAVFVINKQCSITRYGNVEFVPKHTYSSYSRFGEIQLYYNRSKNSLDVKGINDDKLPAHRYMINVFKRIMNMLECNDHQAFVRFINKFVQDYKNRNLKYDYYREFNSRSMYAIQSSTDDSYKYFIPDIIDHSFDDCLDISYNYMQVILPLIQRHYFHKTI